MASDNNSNSDHARDDVQVMEVLRTNFLTQEMMLRALAESVDRRYQAFKGGFDEIVDRLDALVISANMGRNEDMRRLRDEIAQD